MSKALQVFFLYLKVSMQDDRREKRGWFGRRYREEEWERWSRVPRPLMCHKKTWHAGMNNGGMVNMVC